jgi:hypothetical protein
VNERPAPQGAVVHGGAGRVRPAPRSFRPLVVVPGRALHFGPRGGRADTEGLVAADETSCAERAPVPMPTPPRGLT